MTRGRGKLINVAAMVPPIVIMKAFLFTKTINPPWLKIAMNSRVTPLMIPIKVDIEY